MTKNNFLHRAELFFGRMIKQREFFIIIIDLALMIGLSFYSKTFLSYANLHALFLGMSIEVIIAVGMTLLMVSGGFDMSVGSVLAFSGAFSALAIKAGAPIFLAILIGVAVGSIAGLFNGFIIAKLKINAFVTTLASLSLFRGLTLIVTRGLSVTSLGENFAKIGQTLVFNIQTPIIYAFILVIVGDILLRKSRFFRQAYYIGGNEKAARLSGIGVDKIKIICYIIVGALAGFAGVVMASRFGAATPTTGTGLELRVITAVIIGGASLNGGEGTVLGALFGSLLMALITNALTLIGVDIYWHTFVIGGTLITAVLLDQFAKVRKAKKKL